MLEKTEDYTFTVVQQWNRKKVDVLGFSFGFWRQAHAFTNCFFSALNILGGIGFSLVYFAAFCLVTYFMY